MAAKFESVNVGDALPSYVHEKVTRTDLVKYAGASGDYNPMHHDETLAKSVGLPSVFAHGMFSMGLLSNVLNPKPGLFVVAFIPQFVSPARGQVEVQMLVYGAIFAVLTALVFTLLGCFSARLSGWLSRRPKVVAAANVGAGVTFIAAGLSILALGRQK